MVEWSGGSERRERREGRVGGEGEVE